MKDGIGRHRMNWIMLNWMLQRNNKKVREKGGKRTLLDWVVCGGGPEGGPEEGRKTRQGQGQRWRESKRILIRNLKNKIRLPDSKCQPREGKQMEGEREREQDRERGRGEKRGRETFRWDRWGRSDGDTTPSLLPSGGRNTIFLMLRSSTSPGKIFPISHWRETEPSGQAGESSFESVYMCVCAHIHCLAGKWCPWANLDCCFTLAKLCFNSQIKRHLFLSLSYVTSSRLHGETGAEHSHNAAVCFSCSVLVLQCFSSRDTVQKTRGRCRPADVTHFSN